MAIPTTHEQERLSLAYVSAVAARAGAQLLTVTGHEYGLDILLNKVTRLPNGKYTNTGFFLAGQLKATTRTELHPTKVVYDMEVEAYNKLRGWEGETPCVLILFCMPVEQEYWYSLDEERLMLQRCCYWKYIERGPLSGNSSSERIFIPRNQVFTSNAIENLFSGVRGEILE